MHRKVSLLLTTYNSAENLTKTLKSIDDQNYPNIQVCIADSCSTDGTLGIITDYVSRSKYEVKYISQKDSGIYEGLNNALTLADGDYIQVMNDEFASEHAVSDLVNAINSLDEQENESKEEILGAHSDLVYARDGQVIRYWRMGQGTIRSGWMPAHPTLMLKRDVHERYGCYDTTYTCSADYEFIIRILEDGGRLAYVPDVLVSMFYGGTSNKTPRAYLRSITEGIRALHAHHIYPALFITFLRTIRVMRQFR